MKLRVKRAAAALIKNLFGNLSDERRTTTLTLVFLSFFFALFALTVRREFLRDKRIALKYIFRKKKRLDSFISIHLTLTKPFLY